MTLHAGSDVVAKLYTGSDIVSKTYSGTDLSFSDGGNGLGLLSNMFAWYDARTIVSGNMPNKGAGAAGTATPGNSPTYTTDHFTLNGYNQYFRLPYSSSMDNLNFTFGLILKVPSSAPRRMYAGRYQGYSYGGWNLQTDGITLNPSLQSFGGGGGNYTAGTPSPNAPATNTLQMVGFCKNKANNISKTFVNRTFDANSADSSSPTYTNDTFIGANAAGDGNYMAMDLYAAWFYNGVDMTDADLEAIANYYSVPA